MFHKLKQQWHHLKRSPPGQRFQIHYREQRRSGGSKWKRIGSLAAALLALAVGVVLVFIPGPAILFFFIAGALLASHSSWVARGLDWLELRLRSLFGKLSAWWRSHSWRTRVPVVVGALGVVVGVGVLVFEVFTGRLSR